jgi:hypothetical protein
MDEFEADVIGQAFAVVRSLFDRALAAVDLTM